MLGTQPTNARKKFPMAINNNRSSLAPWRQHNIASVTGAQFTTQCRGPRNYRTASPVSRYVTGSLRDTDHGPESCLCTPDHSSEAGVGML